jgi:hypothetical protein
VKAKMERFVTLATGNRVGPNVGYVTALDMAWQMGRIGRWTGAGECFWSDMLHSFVVADLCPDYLKCHALIHDSPECVGNDVPSPMKTAATRRMEHKIMRRTWKGLMLRELTKEEEAIIKVGDNRARNGEAWVIGNDGNRTSYPDRDGYAEKLVQQYLAEFPYKETIERTGRGPREFLARFHKYWAMSHICVTPYQGS